MSLTADSNGQITGRFTIPEHIPAGTKLVEFIGAASAAHATFVGRGTLSIRELRQVTTLLHRETWTWNGDPLAQTFTLDESRLVNGADLWFAAKGSSKIVVQLRATQNGVPTAETLASAALPPASLNLSGPTRFLWTPVCCQANTEYALVILCDDAVSAVHVAELGKFDALHQQWVTAQPYLVGTLLSSSNARTWTAHQTQDLTFRLLGPTFSATTLDIDLPEQAVTAADYLLVLAAIERPLPGAHAFFELTVGDAVYLVTENQPILLSAPYTGTIQWKLKLAGTSTISPRVHGDLQLVWASGLSTGTYITRAIPAGTNSKVRVNLNGFLPGASTLTVEAETATNTWTSVPLDEALDLGDGWTDRRYRLNDLDALETRIRLTLAGTAQERPRARGLQVIITE